MGTLDQVVDDKSTGLKMYVVKTDDKHYTVLYQGSTDFNKEGGKQDWLENDAPMAGAILSKTKMATPQLKKAASVLQEVMDKHKGASFDVYGHSLGSMCAQYAITNVKDTNRIRGAYMYEGPNIYSTLTSRQRVNTAKLAGRAHNYVDCKDSVALGYSDHNGTVGNIHMVKSPVDG
ncbi:Mbeg1-like protein [Alloscardovia theropitheci]|uniref:Mbeg1-like protein n=1 Tax=Alloscardovia theropitheci TaxID=2496842 RepID=UPI00196B8EEB|nr:Mbeg1-like protein [Alloscardovia theropitheci]